MAQISGSTNVSCFGAADGTATVDVTGGTTPYTYLWDASAQTTATATGLAPGTWHVTVTDAKGCQVLNVPVTITGAAAALNITGSGTNPTCYAGSDGHADITVTGGLTPYSYSWSNGYNGQNPTGLTAGSYTVIVTDANGCTATHTYVLGQPAALVLNASGIVNTQCNSSVGSVTLTEASNTPGSFTIGGTPQTGTTATFAGLKAGFYTATFTATATGCTATTTFNIININSSLAATVSVVNPNCFGQTVTATVTATGGTSPYSYSLNGAAGQATGVFNSLGAGNYNVLITDVNGCTYTVAFTITQPDQLILALASQTNAACFGSTTGGAIVQATGGTTPYVYTVDSGGPNTPTVNGNILTGMIAGTYTVRVTDAHSCTTTLPVIITQSSGALTAVAGQITNVKCFGDATGSATVTASNGTAPYTYLWSNGATDQTATNLVAGNYSVVVSDKNGCSATVNSIIILGPASALTANISSSTNPSCEGATTGSATVSATGGTSPYSYLWSNGQTSAIATGLVAGTYLVTVTDANGCTKQLSVLLSDPTGVSALITASTNVSCFGGTNGTATVTASGGSGTYTYLWSSGAGNQTTATATHLPAGQHTVTVTGSGGCTSQAVVTITQPAALNVILVSQSNVGCKGGSNGTIVVDATGGVAPYTFTSSGGAVSGNTISGLIASATPYLITVTDANSCTSSMSVTITEPGNTLAATITSSTNVLCYGTATGSASVTPSGGTSPYTYLWSNGSTDQTASGLIAGTYSVTVTDKNGCFVTLMNAVTITQPAGVITVNAGPDQTICSLISTVNLSGASAANAISYMWTTSGTGIFTNPTSLTLATYTPSAADIATGQIQLILTATGNGTCAVVSDFMVLNIWPPPTVNAGPATAAICAGSTYVLTGATATNYSTLTWTSNAGGTFNNPNALNPTFTPATGFTGTVRLTLTAGKIGSSCSDASNYIDLSVNAAPTLTVSSIINTTCSNSLGSVTLTGSETGTVTLNGISKPSPATFTGLSAGYFTATFTAAGSTACTGTASFQITNTNSNLSGTVTVKNASCNLSTGSVIVNATGGSATGGSITATDGYQYSLDGGVSQPTNSFTGISTGNHTVHITDDNGCSYSIDFYVDQPTLLILELAGKTDVLCYGTATGSAIVNAAGGTTGYNYSVLTGPNTPTVTGNLITGMIAGTYNVQVKDANNCTATLQVVISQPAGPLNITSIPAVLTNPLCNGAASGSINTTVSGGTSPYVYAWNNGTNSADPSGLVAGTYSVTVTDAKGCTITGGPYILTNPPSVTLTASSIVSTTCGASTGSVVLTSSDGSTVTLSGTTKPSGSVFTGLIAGFYTPTSNGVCPATTTFRINNSTSTLTAIITNLTSPSCHNGSGAVIVTGTGGTGTLAYSLDGATSMANGSFINIFPGNHTVTVSDTNGCIYTVNFSINNPPLLTLALTNQTNVSCNGASMGSVIVAALGGSPGYTYSVASEPQGGTNAMVTGNLISNLKSGNYTIRVTDSNGCTADLPVIITQPAPATVYAGIDGRICESDAFEIKGTSATNITSLSWTSNGTGYFNNSNMLNPVYTPGESDISRGSVTLTLNVSQGASCPMIKDSILLNITHRSVANAGADVTIREDSVFNVSTASVKYANSVLWTTNGKGKLTNAETLAPTYTPAPFETGTITLTLTAGSAAPCGTSTDQMILTIVHVNHPPVAVDDNYLAREDQPLTDNVLSNDYDPDGDHVTVNTIPLQTTTHGSLVLQTNGEFTYKPVIDFIGTDTFIYQICDNGIPSLCDTAVVKIVVEKDPNCPVEVPNSFSPNGDGIHDYFKIRCLYNYADPVIEIFNRWGNLVYKKDHYGDVDYWGNETAAWWDGRSDNKLTIGDKNLPVGTYYYILRLNSSKVLTGFLFLNK